MVCCTTGEAKRSKTVDKPIVPILAHLIVGGITDGQGSMKPQDITLEVDGKSSNSWLYAATRVAAYVLDLASEGKIAYKYHLWLKNLRIHRETVIQNNILELNTTVWGKFGPRGEVHKVIFYIKATKIGQQTQISARAVGYTTLGKHCKLIQRKASKEITKALTEVLATVDKKGTKLYHEADLIELTNVLIRKYANESVLGSPTQFRIFSRRS